MTVDAGDQPTWRQLQAAAVARLGEAGVEAAATEARWLVEEASGFAGADLLLLLDGPAPERGGRAVAAMVERRAAGEPIQYVLGHWPFRVLDLLVDRRVLIPRPETEQVVERALAELDGVTGGARRGTVVDLGSGSGAIGLSIAAERPGTDVWCVDASPEALAVTRANLAGLGMAGGRVRVAEGSWFEALPDGLQGSLDLVVANPPYIAEDESLPPEVRDWEPSDALVAGPSGLEDIALIVGEASRWLLPGGALVVEIGATQGHAALDLAATAGLVACALHPDLAGHARALVAHAPR